MNLNTNTGKDTNGWHWRSWLWVLLCAIGIFSTIPVARSIQKFVYKTVGREFFTYAVLFVICAVVVALLYLFIFKLKVKSVSQYIWLFTGAGLYVYFTIQLRQHPEEAVHFLEYGLLSYFLFKALSHKIRDWTIYITIVLFVLFVGTADEFIQWLMPKRFWDYRDVGINTLAGAFFSITIWKGINPKIISKPVQKISIKILMGIITIDLLFLGLCLFNTPDTVKRYTATSGTLMWLRSEESMTEFGYKHNDPEIGTFYSRLTLKELRELDLTSSKTYKNSVKEINSIEDYEKLIRIYTPHTNPFLYEFLLHILRRDRNFDKSLKKNDLYSKAKAFKENLILEKYFGYTLKYFNSAWSHEKINYPRDSASLLKVDYTSRTGKMITSFSLKTAWLFILVMLVVVWTLGGFWKRRLKI